MSRNEDLSFLAGGGEMGQRTRELDWGGTPVGPPGVWQQSLKTAVSICLGSRHPIVMWWGNGGYVQFYNDAYISFLGAGKHPTYLGGSGRDCWSEIWSTIGPMLDGVFASGEATWSEDLLLVLDRNLAREEAYFTFSYSPIRDDHGAIGGIFCACNETTSRVIGERRLRTLSELSRVEAEIKTTEAACEVASRTLIGNPADIPFALIYLLDEDATQTKLQARLVATAGLAGDSAAAPQRIDLGSGAAAAWPLREVYDTRKPLLVSGLSSRFGTLPGGSWPECPEAALIAPIAAPGQARPAGFLLTGLSPRRVVDNDYKNFLDLVAKHIGTSIANARAYEEARKRAETLAELDRAKTTFFSNVSHEFRTPLTLMMGPLEDTLAHSSALSDPDRERLELAHRNSLRLLKLVNTLLDFSRIEAGRLEASYEAIDLAGFTAELASVFRSAIERAGMKLAIDCPSLSDQVFVDREMWEKIVLNLISNAFKFTFEGEIGVSLRQQGSSVQLLVQDTGTGIPTEEIPRLFERFHRIRGARGRSFEGSGIGLALVQELAKLHGGNVRAESEVGQGSRFSVSIPVGKAHLPADRIEAPRTLASTGLQSEAYIEEVSRWLPDARQIPPLAADASCQRPVAPHNDRVVSNARTAPGTQYRILLADDNADMRGYVRRLLVLGGYEVDSVADGLAALRAARLRKPDLVLTDIMMPGMDGFGVLRELRADPELGQIPIILLSARAGEGPRIEGMHAGADDYLIKPFSARELLARVESHLKMAQYRRHATQALRYTTARFETLLNQAPLGVYLVDADLRIREANPTAQQVFGDIPGGLIDRDFDQIIHILLEKDYADEIARIFRHTLATGESFSTKQRAEFRADRERAEYYEWRLDRIRLPDGSFGVVCYFRDISEQVQAAATQQLLLNELNHRVKNTLANVQAIAQQTLKSARDPADFASRFSGRIQSLARAHSMLSAATWGSADLRELIRDQLLQVPETRLTALGPVVRLPPQTTLHLAMMLHELGTNSIKYGALRVPGGWVTVSWLCNNHMLCLEWAERGGPAVTAPVARGFGTTLIEQGAKSEGGSAQMLFEAQGVTWKITLPLPASVKPLSALRGMEMTTLASQKNAGNGTGKRAVLAGKRLLVVEDEPLIGLDLVCSLEKAGADVGPPVGTEREALELIEQSRFDAVLLDANLHGRGVDEIARALTRRKIPFVFVTGYGRKGLPSQFNEMTVLSKPFSEEQVLDAVLGLEQTVQDVLQLNR
jgi:PAS domain S-box-containing protein